MEGGGLCYDRYETGPWQEWMMRIGPAGGRPMLILPPLFEEMNRTRAFLAAIMRCLARRGFCCWLPDLPGTGESRQPLEAVRWEHWGKAARDASAHVAAVAGTVPVEASVRGGTLLDGGGAARWHFAPVEGASLARDLLRASMVSQDELTGPVVELAGYPVADALLAQLRAARPVAPARLRVVRLESDRGEADLKVPGPALWRRSEPAKAPELATALACDISQWVDRCAVS